MKVNRVRREEIREISDRYSAMVMMTGRDFHVVKMETFGPGTIT
jgi:hypothetical protein